MLKALSIVLLVGLAGSRAFALEPSASPSQAIADALRTVAPAQQQSACGRDNPAEVVVCGRSQQHYRIDPTVLASARAAEAPPPKPPVTAETADHCTGADCGGGTIPFVGMALTALKAAELAAQGDDWRDAFRTHPDEYRLYEEEKASEARKPSVRVGLSAGNH